MKIAIIGAGNAGCVTALKLLERRIKPEITIYHDPKEHPIEQVGQGSLPTFPALVYDVLGVDWYNNPIDATLKTGILYEGWGKKQYEIFHPFQMNVVGAHFVPSKLSKLVLESGLVNVVEKQISDPEKEIDADYIFDCRGRHNRKKEKYTELITPVNSVLLCKRNRLPSDAATYTRTIATPNGWTFIIPNKDTVSYGYLYNSSVTTKQEASEDFVYRFSVSHVEHHLQFDSYCADNMFVGKKTILQGNAYSFIEPLEATSVAFYQDLAEEAIDYIYNKKSKADVNTRVNEWMHKLETFLLWHYQFGSVFNTPFWEYARSLPFNPDDQFKYIVDNPGGSRRYYNYRTTTFDVWLDGVI